MAYRPMERRNVRPFDWRDISALHRAQDQCVFLDSALVLTRGAMLVPGALFSYLAPSMGVFTAVAENESALRLMGQVIHLPGAPFAHLTFMAPAQALEQPAVLALTEYLVSVAGERGVLRLLADVDEQTAAFEALHQSGFAIYTRQRIWQINRQAMSKIQPVTARRNSKPATWRSLRSRDTLAIRSFYNNLVPGLVQQVEPYVTQRPHGMVYYEDGELKAYAEFRYGHRGIWVQPFVHPDTEDVPSRLVALLSEIPNRFSRAIYVCVRSYESWLEAAFEDLGAEPGSKQAVMVKHLAIQQKATRGFSLPALEGGQAEISAPLARMERNSLYGSNEDNR